jgi:Transposase DDE domain group 1
MIRKRIYGIASGYDNLNDHDHLRHDTTFQSSVECDAERSSSATPCRLEQRSDHDTAVIMHEVLVEQLISSFSGAPEWLVLDFDVTDNPMHGNQIGKHFNHYYDSYCFLPLYVFCNHQLLVKRLRRQWPDVQIIFLSDSRFCIPRILHWNNRSNVDYIVGIRQKSRLLALPERVRESTASPLTKNDPPLLTKPDPPFFHWFLSPTQSPHVQTDRIGIASASQVSDLT